MLLGNDLFGDFRIWRRRRQRFRNVAINESINLSFFEAASSHLNGARMSPSKNFSQVKFVS